MNIKDLITKGFIDVEDEISFEKKSEIMPLFGFQSYNQQKGFYKLPHDPNVHIWFPVFYQDDGNDWVNTWRQDKEAVFEMRKFDNDAYVAEVIAKPDWHVRILFAKTQPNGRLQHEFKGIFELDLELTQKAKKLVHVRTSNKAKLYPV